MRHATRGLPVGLIVAILHWSPEAWGQGYTYLPGPPPMVGEIRTECVELLPAPRERTTIGIGEQVRCWIDSWQDTDYQVDSYGYITLVQDIMWSATWSADGPGTVYPTTGTETCLTADLADADGIVMVTAIVRDSGFLGADPPVAKNKAIVVNRPTGLTVLTVRDEADPAWAAGAANLGGRSVFLMQVLPVNVNFINVSFRSKWDTTNWTWPDATAGSSPAGEALYGVKDFGGTHNLVTPDSLNVAGLHPVARIAGQDFTLNFTAAQTFKDKAGAWAGYGASLVTQCEFQGATSQTRVGFSAGNQLWGGWMGPWK